MSRGGQRSHWAMLGLERGAEPAEIRRAYARKLKATDVDADPAAFIALREAFERALGEAEARRRREAGGDEDEAWPDAPLDPPLLQAPAPPLPAAEGESESEAGEDENARFIALDRLLFPGEAAPPPDPGALVEAVRAILDHPDMGRIDRSASVESWLAETLCDAIPRSDPVIPMVIDHFHWDRKAGHWDQPWMFEALIKRRYAFDLVEQLADPRHRFHTTYLDLTSDAPTLGLKTIGRTGDVATLLNKIRTEAPAAEAWLNPHRVGLWDERLNNSVPRRLRWVAIIFAVMFAIQVFGPTYMTSPPTQASPVRDYADPAALLDPMLREVSGGRLGLADVAARNRILHDRLMARWQRARADDDQSFLIETDLRAIIAQSLRETLRGGSTDLQADYWRLAADQLIWLRARDPDSCERSIDGALPTGLPATFAVRRRAIITRALAEGTPADPPAELAPGVRHSYTIPGPIFADATRHAGLSLDAMQNALLGRGTATQRCDARIGVIEAAVAARGVEGGSC